MWWDTSRVAAGQRVDAIAALIGELGIDCSVTHERSDTTVHARLQAEHLGAVGTFTYAGSGIRMVQPGGTARAAPEVLAVAVQGRGPGVLVQHERRRLLRPGDLVLIDHTSAYDYRWHGDGGADSVNIPLEGLGLPVELVRRACVQVVASPLRALVTGHIRRLSADAARLAGDAGAGALGEATIELVRALVMTAAAGRRDGDTTSGLPRVHHF
jgi:hypothetical protein